MNTKLGKVTYNDELPRTKLHDSSITWFCEVTYQIRWFMSLLVLAQWPPILEGGDLHERLPPIISNNPLNMPPCLKFEATKKQYISTITMTTKLVMMVKYCEEDLTINAHGLSMTWFCKITWKIRNFISSLAKDPWNQTRHGTDLTWDTPSIKYTWIFDCVAKVFFMCVSKTLFRPQIENKSRTNSRNPPNWRSIF